MLASVDTGLDNYETRSVSFISLSELPTQGGPNGQLKLKRPSFLVSIMLSARSINSYSTISVLFIPYTTHSGCADIARWSSNRTSTANVGEILVSYWNG